MNRPMNLCAAAATAFLAIAAFVGAGTPSSNVDPLIARGRYLVGYGSCNDCHTPGWRESDGKIPVADWMVGTSLGYRGPWGTSYPANARREFSRISENDWLFMAGSRGGHWPMVWHDIRMLDEDDRRAIYRFIKSLGAKGVDSPNDLSPSLEPKTPYVWVVPH
jgi:mono/diheme cytochrome c family protein